MVFKKPNFKNPLAGKPPVERLREGFSRGMQRLFGLPDDWMARRDIGANNFALGRAHFEQGNLQDAALRFQMVTWLRPGNPEAWYYLAAANLGLGKKNKGAAALKKTLSLKPDHAQAKELLAALEQTAD